MFSQFQTGKYNGKLFVPSCNGFEIFAGSIEQGEKFEFNHYQANVDYLFRMQTFFSLYVYYSEQNFGSISKKYFKSQQWIQISKSEMHEPRDFVYSCGCQPAFLLTYILLSDSTTPRESFLKYSSASAPVALEMNARNTFLVCLQ